MVQTAYEIRVGINRTSLGKGKEIIWESGNVLSDKSIHVPYSGPGLKTAEKYYWQVKVWDNNGKNSGWSELAFWQMGLLDKAEWKAKWIKAGKVEELAQQSSPLFRKQFCVLKNSIGNCFYYGTWLIRTVY